MADKYRDEDIDEIDDEDVEEEDSSEPEARPSSGQRNRRPYPTPYRRQGGAFRPRRKVCAFCADKVKVIDWKQVDLLRRFVGDDGSIRARRKTGTCAKHQRRLAVAVKRARYLALLPFTGEHVRLHGR